MVGDCTTVALVGCDGAVSWLPVPRFDSNPIFCGLLDRARGGHFRISLANAVEVRQTYVEDTPVLQTEQRNDRCRLRITDAFTLRSGAQLSEDVGHGRGELLRIVDVLDGASELVIDLAPRGGAGLQRAVDALRVSCRAFPDVDLRLTASIELNDLTARVPVRAGDRLWFVLRWGDSVSTRVIDPEVALANVVQAWRRWMGAFTYEGPQQALVRRSALTLKLLDYSPNGAIVAAATSSLPEAIGGVRNWDYRYTWVRDAAFSVYALRRIGFPREGESFLEWVLNIAEQGKRPRVLYDLDGSAPPPERIDGELEGYRGSRPVRWGNAAADQRQHDVYGELLDCAYQWAHGGARIDPALWGRLQHMVGGAAREWREPDHGIWEVRTPGRPFTYSAGLCHVALDRGAKLAERFRLPGNPRAWRATAECIRAAILEEAWDERRQALVEHLGGGGLDASLLSLPLRHVIAADHPRMVATAAAVARDLGAGQGLVYRYRPDASGDGVQGEEGAFLLCSFWLVDNYARQGRLAEAHDLYASLCARATPLGLLPEQIDPATGAFLGNYPQAFSHVGVIASGLNLAGAARPQTR